MENTFTSFLCPSCKTEIEATLDMCGVTTECPACGASFTVPAVSDDGVIRHSDDDSLVRSQAMKSRTIRIELSDL